MRERLAADLAPAVVAHVSGPGIRRDLATVWPFMLQAHRAHAAGLRDVEAVPRDALDALSASLARLTEDGPGAIDIDDDLEDAYFAIERHLAADVGAEQAGWLQTGRSRNDHYACVARLWVRSELLAIVDGAGELRQVMLDLAENHLETVMTGYTHQQPAQPITFGHYLLGVEASLARDVDRLRDAWPRVNRCPLGAGSMAGVSWPLDRPYLAELLAFDGPEGNSLDAVASRDTAHETVGAMALLAVTISRLAADLQQFATWEFGLVEVGDDVAAVSSVMPQKKNPVTLEHARGACAQVIGAWTAMVASAKGTPFAHHREASIESMRGFLEATAQTHKTVALMTATLRGLRVDAARMATRAAENFSTATDLADLLVRKGGLSFRQAHGVVGAGVRRALAEGPSWFTPQRVRDLVREATGAELTLEDADVVATLDPAGSVRARSVAGGPAPSATQDQLDVARRRCRADEDWLAERRRAIDAIDARLADTTGAEPSPTRRLT